MSEQELRTQAKYEFSEALHAYEEAVRKDQFERETIRQAVNADRTIGTENLCESYAECCRKANEIFSIFTKYLRHV